MTALHIVDSAGLLGEALAEASPDCAGCCSRSSTPCSQLTPMLSSARSEDIAAWGWAEAPASRLVFAADIPKLDRALGPDVDARLMAAAVELSDPFARVGCR